jgi:hypothetical protein
MREENPAEQELIDAPVVLPDNTELAKRAAEVISSGFKKLGKMLDETINADRRPIGSGRLGNRRSKGPSWDQIREAYKTRTCRASSAVTFRVTLQLTAP